MDDLPPQNTSSTFPKIAVLLGADTNLGQALLYQLLNSPDIEVVHAIASSEIDLLSHLPTNVLRKARVHLNSYQTISRAFSRIPECDLAFSVATTPRHAYSLLGHELFHQQNHALPVVFVNQMFKLGVLHLAILSSEKADPNSRSQFHSAKGLLEQCARRLRREAAEFAPHISIYKVPPLVTAVHDSETQRLASAILYDSLSKSARSTTSLRRKKRGKLQQFFSQDVQRLYRDSQYAHPHSYHI